MNLSGLNLEYFKLFQNRILLADLYSLPTFYSRLRKQQLTNHLCSVFETKIQLKTSFLDKKIGLLGGGQLGLMMVQAASDFHLKPEFLDPDSNAAVKPYAVSHLGSFRDYKTVLDFGQNIDLISIEIEDVNLQALYELEAMGKSVFPQPRVLEVIKNKTNQKEFFKKFGFPSPEYLPFQSQKTKEMQSFLPAFWKQNEGGYDGKGVLKIETEADLVSVPNQPGFLEKKVDIKKELAVLVARNQNGDIELFPVVEMVFHPTAHLVSYLKSPADISAEVESECRRLAQSCIEKLEMVGLLAVELFLDSNNKVLINEMAPRPHNSGHHTIEGNLTSQFQQFWRAILNLPLGKTDAIFPFSAMVNLIGEPDFVGKPIYQGLEESLTIPGVFPHLYGKSETRPYRKMGHVTIVAQTLLELEQKVYFVENHLKITA